MRVGIVANEFLDARINRVGGFGWAARRAADVLAAAGHHPVFLTGEVRGIEEVGGHPLIPLQSRRLAYVRRVRSARLDVVLSIDFRPSYLPALLAVPRTLLILWVRDPHSTADRARIDELRSSRWAQPGAWNDTRSAGRLLRSARWTSRRVVLASPAPGMLRARATSAYQIGNRELALLPNPIETPDRSREPCARPRVLALNRLEAVKRPWLIVELARRMPDVEFVVGGAAFAAGSAAWRPIDPPVNARFVGNVSGQAKADLLASSWLFVNTAIHEGLPVSFLEALANELPIVAEVEADGVTERFGIRTPPAHGDGVDGLPAVQDAVRALIDDPRRRGRLGVAGRDWVRAVHSSEAFLGAFERLAAGG